MEQQRTWVTLGRKAQCKWHDEMQEIIAFFIPFFLLPKDMALETGCVVVLHISTTSSDQQLSKVFWPRHFDNFGQGVWMTQLVSSPQKHIHLGILEDVLRTDVAMKTVLAIRIRFPPDCRPRRRRRRYVENKPARLSRLQIRISRLFRRAIGLRFSSCFHEKKINVLFSLPSGMITQSPDTRIVFGFYPQEEDEDALNVNVNVNVKIPNLANRLYILSGDDRGDDGGGDSEDDSGDTHMNVNVGNLPWDFVDVFDELAANYGN